MIKAKLDSQRAVLENELEFGTIYRLKDTFNLLGYVRMVYMGKNEKGKHTFCDISFKGGMLFTISKKYITQGEVIIENGYSK